MPEKVDIAPVIMRHKRGGMPKSSPTLDRVDALMADGADRAKIAAELGVSDATAKQYMSKARVRAGTAKKHVYVRGTLAERLAALTVDAPEPKHMPGIGPCRVWIGHVGKWGKSTIHDPHGEIGPKNKKYRVYQAAYRLAHPETGDADIRLMHRCDDARCIRLEHLRPGTQLENMRDAIDKGRHVSVARSVLTADHVREIRRRFDAGEKSTDIARSMGLPADAVWRAATRKSWSRVA